MIESKKAGVNGGILFSKEKMNKVQSALNEVIRNSNKKIRKADFYRYFWANFFEEFRLKKIELKKIINGVLEEFKFYDWILKRKKVMMNVLFYAIKLNVPIENLLQTMREYSDINLKFGSLGLELKMDLHLEGDKFSVVVEVMIPWENIISDFKIKFKELRHFTMKPMRS